ncbi:DUF5067 domain-containing protein [Cytobacillus sp. S13-E01]|uniref:DUF5067 domain-containing protein n=1 Tax=Cytobacillus sp. S13-E01 TaxID=3031326 RepID=UPI0023D8676E|nr:DUF5067 domain-containing protein [Cytobacillus sp. S13-E01]MDF0728921.1 DUF5067 domain-containing protein [Cytobacillus sp. S13-E01]
MKKRIFFLFISLLTAFVIAGCGQDEGAGLEIDPDSGNNVGVTDDNANEPKETENAEENKDVYFKDNEVKLEDLKIKITETKVIPAGKEGNEYGDKPVFAIWYDTTNLTDKDINATTAWLAVFEAVQDNDPNVVNTLNVGSLPDAQFRESQLQTIKKDGTVSNAVAYELDDLETPVTLIASQGILGGIIGEQNFDIKGSVTLDREEQISMDFYKKLVLGSEDVQTEFINTYVHSEGKEFFNLYVGMNANSEEKEFYNLNAGMNPENSKNYRVIESIEKEGVNGEISKIVLMHVEDSNQHLREVILLFGKENEDYKLFLSIASNTDNEGFSTIYEEVRSDFSTPISSQ